MTRTTFIRLAVYGTLGLVLAVGLVNPYTRQLFFGPKIRGTPLCYWQDLIRAEADPQLRDPSIRATALRWLGLGRRQIIAFPKEADMVPVYLSLLDDPNPAVRIRLAPGLARAPESAGAIEGLERLLDDPVPEVRAAAADACQTKPHELDSLLPRLTAMLDDGDMLCRVHAAVALGINDRLAPAVAQRVFAEAVRGSDTLAGASALRLLTWLDPEPQRYRAAIAPVLAHESWAATDALVKCGPKVLPLVETLLDDADPHVRASAARVLATHGAGARASVPALQARRHDPNPAVAMTVECALHLIDPVQFPLTVTKPR